MKIFRWRFSNYWLFVLLPVAVALIPIFFFGLIVAGHLGGAVFGPPPIWNRPLKQPPLAELAGSYLETERHWQDGQIGQAATMSLNADGSMSMSNLPDSDGITNCTLSASGSWKVAQDENAAIDLTITKTDSATSCQLAGLPYGIFNVLNVSGHSKPYRLYWILGDPDSGEGIWFQRK